MVIFLFEAWKMKQAERTVIYIPLWLYSYMIPKDEQYAVDLFTFHYGYILILFPSINNYIYVLIYIPLWLYSYADNIIRDFIK